MIMSSKISRANMSLAEEEHKVDEEQGAGGGIDLPSLASKMEQVDLVGTVVDPAVGDAVVVVADLFVAAENLFIQAGAGARAASEGGLGTAPVRRIT